MRQCVEIKLLSRCASAKVYAKPDEIFALMCAKLGRAHGRLSQCYLEIGDARLCLEAANEHLSSAKEHNDVHGQAVGGSWN